MVKMITLLVVAICTSVFSISAYAQNAPDVELLLSNEVYHYGDKLEYMIIVSEITGYDARIYITDPMGNKSPLVDIPISEEKTHVIAPIGFDKIIWNEGKYSLELNYSDSTFEIDFTITDDGSIGIPYWINDLAKLWLTVQIPDKEYAKGIQYMIEQEILANPEPGDTLHIPNWFKFTTAWWSAHEISDTTYAHGIQYLIDKKFMTIPSNQTSSDLPPESFL